MSIARQHIASLVRAAAFAAAIAASLPAAATPIARVEIAGLHSLSEEEVREVIGIRPGEELAPETLERAVGHLRAWGAFDSVEVAPKVGPEGAIVHFRFQEATAVVAIDIVGNYPYIENKIRKNLTLHPGDVFTPERVAEQVERIQEFYAREGYVGTEVVVDEERLPDKGGVVLTFNIHHGRELRLRSIEVSGNRAFPNGRFVSMLEPWRQFSERRLARALRRIREFYQERGWPKARVKLSRKAVDLEAGRVDLALEIEEGPKVKLLFVGSSHLHPRRLRKAVTILREGSLDSYEIERSVEALEIFFRDRGYPDTKIDATRYDHADGRIVIVFRITKNLSSRIHWLSFRGAGPVDDGELQKGMANRQPGRGQRGLFFPQEEERDDAVILEEMRREGFLDARVEPWEIRPTPQGYAKDITVPIERGPQTIVAEIAFSGHAAFEIPRLLKELKIRPGRPLDEPGLEEDQQRLLAFYADNGYPYVEISQRWERTEPDRAVIRYDIAEGARVTIGRILIVGDVLTSQKAIKQAMEIGEGDPFSSRRILESRIAIRRLGAFASVNIETIGLEDRQSLVHLKVKVEEERPFQVDLGLSYSTAEWITGSFTFRNLNAFGWAKTNSLKLIGGPRLSRAEIGWFDPRFLSSSFEMSTNGWIQYQKRPSYAYSQIGGALGWLRKLRRFNLAFRWEIDRNYFVSGDSVAADANSLRNSTISQTSLSGSFDSRDSFSDPRRGFFTMGDVDIFNEIKGREANFFRFSWLGENELTPQDRLTFATEMRFARILTAGGNVSVPSNELLFLGGADTIRGFSEDSLGPLDTNGNATGARLRWIWNEELRIRLWRSLQWAFFADMGSLTETFSQIDWGAVRKSAGFGLRYMTPVGPIRGDYGIKLDRHAGESFGRFHLTFGYVF